MLHGFNHSTGFSCSLFHTWPWFHTQCPPGHCSPCLLCCLPGHALPACPLPSDLLTCAHTVGLLDTSLFFQGTPQSWLFGTIQLMFLSLICSAESVAWVFCHSNPPHRHTRKMCFVQGWATREVPDARKKQVIQAQCRRGHCCILFTQLFHQPCAGNEAVVCILVCEGLRAVGLLVDASFPGHPVSLIHLLSDAIFWAGMRLLARFPSLYSDLWNSHEVPFLKLTCWRHSQTTIFFFHLVKQLYWGVIDMH